MVAVRKILNARIPNWQYAACIVVLFWVMPYPLASAQYEHDVASEMCAVVYLTGMAYFGWFAFPATFLCNLTFVANAITYPQWIYFVILLPYWLAVGWLHVVALRKRRLWVFLLLGGVIGLSTFRWVLILLDFIDV